MPVLPEIDCGDIAVSQRQVGSDGRCHCAKTVRIGVDAVRPVRRSYTLGIKDVAAKVDVFAERVDKQKFTENGWAQVKVVGAKIELLKDKEPPKTCRLKGGVPISLATSAGTFDESFPLDVVAEEFPFLVTGAEIRGRAHADLARVGSGF